MGDKTPIERLDRSEALGLDPSLSGAAWKEPSRVVPGCSSPIVRSEPIQFHRAAQPRPGS